MLKGTVGNRILFEKLHSVTKAKVIGVFSSGIYLEISDDVVLLYDAKWGVLPFGIALDDFQGQGKNLGLEAGMPVWIEEDILCLGDKLRIKIVYENLVIDNIDRDCLSCFLERAKPELLKSENATLLLYGFSDIDKLNKDEIEDIFSRAAYRGMTELSDALIHDSNIENSVSKLIGLGRGLTPSMDDFICGMLFTFWFSEKSLHYSFPFLKQLSLSCKKLAKSNTNKFSAAYIISAADGEDFSLMRKCFESSRDSSFPENINKLLDLGSSSGADMLCGMCFATNYILKHY